MSEDAGRTRTGVRAHKMNAHPQRGSGILARGTELLPVRSERQQAAHQGRARELGEPPGVLPDGWRVPPVFVLLQGNEVVDGPATSLPGSECCISGVILRERKGRKYAPGGFTVKLR